MTNRATAGYSLVELVAAIAIFSLAVTSVLALFSACLQATSASLSYTHAVTLAEKILEETALEGDFTPGSDSGDFGEDFPRHSWETETESCEQEGLYQIRVVVKWNEQGREREYALTTLVAERDVS